MKKALLITLLGLATSLASANILITEIMYKPVGTDVAAGPPVYAQEWVEIYNSGDTTVDLTGWKLRDEDANSADWGTLTGSLDPGQAGVITTASDAEFKASWSTATSATIFTVSGWGSIANTVTASGNEVIQIWDASDVVIDIADYLTVAPWPTGTPDGQSIYLLPGFISQVDNDNGANWGSSNVGIDGAINPVAGIYPFDVGSVGSPGVVVVPEPSTFALLTGLGILGLAIYRRRR